LPCLKDYDLFLKKENYSFFPKKNETTQTTMTAPAIEGSNAMPAKDGPQLPKRDCPTDEPIKPAKTLAIIPIEPPFLVIPPAMRPIRPPTIIDHSIMGHLSISKNIYLNIINLH